MAHLQTWAGTVPCEEREGADRLLTELRRRLLPGTERQVLERAVRNLREESAEERDRAFAAYLDSVSSDETDVLLDQLVVEGEAITAANGEGSSAAHAAQGPAQDVPMPAAQPAAQPEEQQANDYVANLPDDPLPQPGTREERLEVARRLWAAGSNMPLWHPQFDVLDYLKDGQQITRKQKAEQVVSMLNSIVAKMLAKHNDELNTANLVGLVIQRIVSSPEWSLLARFSIFRWRNPDGDDLEMLEYQWLDLVLAHDDAWRMYSRSLLHKLKTEPQTLTAAETDDVLFGKGDSNRHTVSGKERKRKALPLPRDEEGNVQWLRHDGQIVRPLREKEDALRERPNEETTRETTYFTPSELQGRFQAARMTVVPVRPNSCHLEVKLYGRYLQNPLTDITSAACFKSTVYEKPGKEGPKQSAAEKKKHLPSVTKRQNDLRLPVLSEMAVSHPRPQLADPRVVKEGQGDLITAPEWCTQISYESTANKAGGKGVVATNRTYGLLRFEVVGVTVGDDQKIEPPAQAYDANGEPNEAMNSFLTHVRAAAVDLGAEWTGNGAVGTPLVMAWGAHALVTQEFTSPEVAQDMLRKVLPPGTKVVNLFGDRTKWNGHVVEKLEGVGYHLHLLPVRKESIWDVTLGLRVHEKVMYGQSDANGTVSEQDLAPVGYNLRYVSSDGFPNTAPSDPSGFYVDAKGNRVDTVPVRIGERAVYVDSYYRGARKVFNEQTMAFEDAVNQNPANHYAPQQPPGPHQLTLWWKENKPPSSHAHTVDPDVTAAPDKQIFPPDRSVMPTLFDQHILRRATWEATRSQDAIAGRGGYGAPMLERPPDGLDKMQRITWFARQIVRHVELWNTDYYYVLQNVPAAQQEEALMRLRQRPRFFFTESPHRDWQNGPKMGVPEKVKEYVQTTATEVNRRQRQLREETVKPRATHFCQYELPLRRITDSSEQVYEGWAQGLGRPIPDLLYKTDRVRRDVRHSASATPSNPTVGKMYALGERVDELQFAEDLTINPARNFQLHDTMHTAHATLTSRLRDSEGKPITAEDYTPTWVVNSPTTLGEAVQKYVEDHYGMFYFTTSLLHAEMRPLGLPERAMATDDAVVHDRVILRPLGLTDEMWTSMRDKDRNTLHEKERTVMNIDTIDAVKLPHAFMTPLARVLRGDEFEASEGPERSVGPGALKIVARFDTFGKAGFGGADTFAGLVSNADEFCAVPPQGTQRSSAWRYARGANVPTEGTYSNLTVEQVAARARSREVMWIHAPDWWKISAHREHNQDLKFLPIDETGEPSSTAMQRSVLLARLKKLVNPPQPPAAQPDPEELPDPGDRLDFRDLPPLQVVPMSLDASVSAESALDTDAAKKKKAPNGSSQDVPTNDETPGVHTDDKRKGRAKAEKKKPEDRKMSLMGGSTNPWHRVDTTLQEGQRNDAFESAVYVTVYDYDDFAIARARCDVEFARLMAANPHWYHHHDTCSIDEADRIVQNTTWEAWMPWSDVHGDGCLFSGPLGMDEDDPNLHLHFPFAPVRKLDDGSVVTELPRKGTEGQYRWHDGCCKPFPNELEAYNIRPRTRFWNSWMHDRARFGSPAFDGTDPRIAFVEEVQRFQVAYERQQMDEERRADATRADRALTQLIRAQTESVKFVSWVELLLQHRDNVEHPAFTRGSFSLASALLETGRRLGSMRGTLRQFRTFCEGVTEADKTVYATQDLEASACVAKKSPADYGTNVFDAQRLPELHGAVRALLSGLSSSESTTMVAKLSGHVSDAAAAVDRALLERALQDAYFFDFESTAVQQVATAVGNEEFTMSVGVWWNEATAWGVGQAHGLAPLPLPNADATAVTVLYLPATLRDVLRDVGNSKPAHLASLRKLAAELAPLVPNGVLEENLVKLERANESLLAFASSGANVGTVEELEAELRGVDVQPGAELALVQTLARELAEDSILAAHMRPVRVVPPRIGGLVLANQDERNMRASMVMSVIKLFNPFMRETLLLRRLVESGVQEEEPETLSLLLPDYVVVELQTSQAMMQHGLDAAIDNAMDENDRNTARLTKQGVLRQIEMLNMGLDYPTGEKESKYVKDRVAEFKEALFSPIKGDNLEEIVNDRMTNPVDYDNLEEIDGLPYDKAADLELLGFGLTANGEVGEENPSVGATEQGLLTGNMLDDRTRELSPSFDGSEVYGPKGAYVRYLYDMARPLEGQGRDRRQEHLARGASDLAEGDGPVLPAVREGVLTYDVFRMTLYNEYPQLGKAELADPKLAHPGLPGAQGALGQRPETVSSAYLRFPMQDALPEMSPLRVPEPVAGMAFDGREMLENDQFRHAYNGFVLLEEQEVLHAATDAQRSYLKMDYGRRSQMEFDRVCVPHLGVLVEAYRPRVAPVQF